ncbi:MAG: hypothetical protein HKM23_04175 [Nitrosopumilus sp.]|nr:hypothetical protein [Nitrosopumilus sp.]NNL58447.1 hypothetical protein [Nitrosopumilus sp.]
MGEIISYDGLELTFYDIKDSRCPLDVTCIWEGEVVAKIRIQNQTHDYYDDFRIGTPISKILPYYVTLVDVVPHPTTAQTPNYMAIFDVVNFDYVEKIESKNSNVSSPLKQLKSGIPFSEIKCNGNLQLTQRYDNSPACVKSETVFGLIKRGWVSDIIMAVQSRDVFLDPQDATSSYMEKAIPTLDDFKRTLAEPYSIDTIFSKFGTPHDDIGSGIHIYVYELNDSTKIWIGYTDHIWYVKHVDLNGNVLGELFVENED